MLQIAIFDGIDYEMFEHDVNEFLKQLQKEGISEIKDIKTLFCNKNESIAVMVIYNEKNT